MKKKTKLVWNVLFHDFNRDRIELYNVFEHFGFYKDLKKANKKNSDDEKFFEETMNLLSYYFWAKCEYEVIVSGLFDGNDCEKIDIYSQIEANRTAFKEYLLAHRKDI